MNIDQSNCTDQDTEYLEPGETYRVEYSSSVWLCVDLGNLPDTTFAQALVCLATGEITIAPEGEVVAISARVVV